MRGLRLAAAAALTLLAAAGLAAPAAACRYSRPVFSAQPHRVQGVEVRVRVEQILPLSAGRMLAVRATVLGDSRLARRGQRIVIIIPGSQPDNCYYYGFADPETLAADGSLTGYVDLLAQREPSGAFSAVAAHRRDARLYERRTRSGNPGGWRRARFTRGDGLIE